MSSDPVGVAIVTGGCSGIGLALSLHLAAKNWHVYILDIQDPVSEIPTEAVTFLKTDVSDWDQLASAFQTAYSRFSRLDFVALNAGIVDRDEIFGSISGDPANPPKSPNMLTFGVNLYGPYYGLKLAAHYMSLPGGKAAAKGGKVVMTSSMAGIRVYAPYPQYSSSKYGVLGLTRAVAPASEKVGIRVNCVCPALVATGMAPPGLENFPKSIITPMSTMIRAFDELCEFDKLAAEGKEAWVASGPNGAVVEANLQNVTYREEPPRESDPIVDNGMVDALTTKYEERNSALRK
ncbi:hypothetical protein KVR01_000776 [Diaporthe batatas]|uniref:uncharacterized protein n=1 Tax=Diaporthe batatas TaxID=748121 RepID=UPI001D0432A9|nr:uncharacterized protein KVR01_000776 [Diaporthe batatas]KAG8170031.1 hypothetical protein KVR01_000776 [Diaporthe batatas]